jgi:hypothetical protein
LNSYFSFSLPAELISLIAGPEEAKNRGEKPPPVSDPFRDVEYAEHLACFSTQLSLSAPVLSFISVDQTERCNVSRLRLGNPDCPRVRINA